MESASDDRLTKSKTIYDAKASEIIWKNFLAGFSRAFGGIFVYFIFIAIFGSLLFRFAMPIIAPFLDQISNLTSTLQKMPKF